MCKLAGSEKKRGATETVERNSLPEKEDSPPAGIKSGVEIQHNLQIYQRILTSFNFMLICFMIIHLKNLYQFCF